MWRTTDNARVTVRGRVVHIVPWCKGAAPPDGIGNREEPGTRTLLLREGDSNSEATALEVKPDSDGRFVLELPANRSYCVLATDQRSSLAETLAATENSPAAAFGLDRACIERQWRACLAVIELGQQAPDEVLIHTSDHCSWQPACATSLPDPPPSAPPGF